MLETDSSLTWTADLKVGLGIRCVPHKMCHFLKDCNKIFCLIKFFTLVSSVKGGLWQKYHFGIPIDHSVSCILSPTCKTVLINQYLTIPNTLDAFRCLNQTFISHLVDHVNVQHKDGSVLHQCEPNTPAHDQTKTVSQGTDSSTSLEWRLRAWGRSSISNRYRDCWRLDRAEARNRLSWNWLSTTFDFLMNQQQTEIN